MFSTKGLQIAIAAIVLAAVSAPTFAGQTPDCMRKIGVCDRGEEHKQHAVSAGGNSPAEGEPDPTGGENTDTSPQVE